MTFYQVSASTLATGFQVTSDTLSSTSKPNGLFESIQKWIETQNGKPSYQTQLNALLRLKKQIPSIEATCNSIVMLLNNNLAVADAQQASLIIPNLRSQQSALSKALDAIQPDVDFLYTSLGGDQDVAFSHIESLRLDTVRDIARLNGELNIAIRSLNEYIIQDNAYKKENCQ